MVEPNAYPELRAALIRAAREILDEREGALELRKVAERVGKSRTAPYLVFGPTEEGGGLRALRLAVAADGLGELVDGVEKAVAAVADPERALHAVGVTYIDFARRHPRLFRLMFGREVAQAIGRTDTTVTPREEVQDLITARARLEGRIRQVIEDCQRVGAIGPGDVYPHVMAAWSMFHGAALLLIDGQLDVAGVARSPSEAADFAASFLLEDAALPMSDAALSFAEALGKKSVSPRAPVMADWDWEDEEAESPRVEHLAFGPRPTMTEAASAYSPPPTDSLALVRSVIADAPSLRRARRARGATQGSRVLWIDDRPALSSAEQRMLEALGIVIERATDTSGALERLEAAAAGRGRSPYDLIVSDIARADSPSAGVDALPLLRQMAPDTPVLFYVGQADPEREPPPGAFGLTSDPGELLHLVLDVLERRRG